MNSTSTLLEVPSHVDTHEKLRHWAASMARTHRDGFRYRTPGFLKHQRRVTAAPTELPFVELPQEFAEYEAKLRADWSKGIKPTAEDEAEYQQIGAALDAFDDATFARLGRFRRRKTVMCKPDPKPKMMAAGPNARAGAVELVTRGLTSTPCRVCVETPDGEFATQAECEAACGGIVTPCCSDSVPSTLVVTVTATTCTSCLVGMMATLTYDPISVWWIGNFAPGGGDCSTAGNTAILQCNDGVFTITAFNGSCNLSGSCSDPVNLTGTLISTGIGSVCVMGDTVSVVVTTP